LHAGFGLGDAAALADYLAALGVSHPYSSPSLQAAPGSTHGCDVVDPRVVNVELGGEQAHARLSAALYAHGLGIPLAGGLHTILLASSGHPDLSTDSIELPAESVSITMRRNGSRLAD